MAALPGSHQIQMNPEDPPGLEGSDGGVWLSTPQAPLVLEG